MRAIVQSASDRRCFVRREFCRGLSHRREFARLWASLIAPELGRWLECLFAGEQVQLVDLRRLGKEISRLYFFHQSGRYFAVEMGLPARFIVERVENGELSGAFFDRIPACRTGFREDQRQCRSQKIGNLGLLAGLGLQRNIQFLSPDVG